MKYITFINELLKSEISKLSEFVVYGQNVSTGSCLGGLTHDFHTIKGCHTLNTTNTENSLVGMGFGLMMSGVSSAFFMKQQDFLLLGIDHLRNTFNFIRQQESSSSFTIVNIIMDGGYEGIQSSLNNLSDFCSIADCQGYTISSKQEAISVIKKNFVSHGFRIISVSQRLFSTEILDFPGQFGQTNPVIVKYQDGNDLTIACFNFTLPQGKLLCEQLKQLGIRSSLFSVITAHAQDYEQIIHDAKKTNRLVILDDSKSCNSVCNNLEIASLRAGIKSVVLVRRKVDAQSYRPLSEVFDVLPSDVITKINFSK
jgi:pyruvate/2-oxoglutarate/acetoin dehydrogenase E1 component